DRGERHTLLDVGERHLERTLSVRLRHRCQFRSPAPFMSAHTKQVACRRQDGASARRRCARAPGRVRGTLVAWGRVTGLRWIEGIDEPMPTLRAELLAARR